MDEKLVLAKKNFIDSSCIISMIKEDKKVFFESCNIPDDVIKTWVVDYVNEMTNECYMLINEYLHQRRLEIGYFEKIAIRISMILKRISLFEIDYYSQIINLLSKLSETGILMDCFNDYSDYVGQVLHKGLFLWNKEAYNYIFNSSCYYFDTNEKFLGLLPYLYKKKKEKLFEEYFFLLLKYSPLYISFETFIDYCNFIILY